MSMDSFDAAVELAEDDQSSCRFDMKAPYYFGIGSPSQQRIINLGLTVLGVPGTEVILDPFP